MASEAQNRAKILNEIAKLERRTEKAFEVVDHRIKDTRARMDRVEGWQQAQVSTNRLLALLAGGSIAISIALGVAMYLGGL